MIRFLRALWHACWAEWHFRAGRRAIRRSMHHLTASNDHNARASTARRGQLRVLEPSEPEARR